MSARLSAAWSRSCECKCETILLALAVDGRRRGRDSGGPPQGLGPGNLARPLSVLMRRQRPALAKWDGKARQEPICGGFRRAARLNALSHSLYPQFSTDPSSFVRAHLFALPSSLDRNFKRSNSR